MWWKTMWIGCDGYEDGDECTFWIHNKCINTLEGKEMFSRMECDDILKQSGKNIKIIENNSYVKYF